jgi:hypothetical protein
MQRRAPFISKMPQLPSPATNPLLSGQKVQIPLAISESNVQQMHPTKCSNKNPIISSRGLRAIHEHFSNPRLRQILGPKEAYRLAKSRLFIWILRRGSQLSGGDSGDCLGDLLTGTKGHL